MLGVEVEDQVFLEQEELVEVEVVELEEQDLLDQWEME
jgi:hypothetical protein